MAEYNFSKDIVVGENGESVVVKDLESIGGIFIQDNKDNKFDIIMNINEQDIKYEIKTDVFCKPENDTGNLFIEYFTQKLLLNFYIIGTFFGGLLFVFSQNYFPLFEGKSSLLVGASAGISAIFIGVATYIPNYQLKLRFIGFIKLWHLAAFWIGLDIIGLIGSNSGGHFAHLGGSLFGFLYVKKANNKKTDFFKQFLSLFIRKKTPLKTVHKSAKKKSNSLKNTDITQKQIDSILDKISKSGYDTLTKTEKDFLFRQGKK